MTRKRMEFDMSDLTRMELGRVVDNLYVLARRCSHMKIARHIVQNAADIRDMLVNIEPEREPNYEDE